MASTVAAPTSQALINYRTENGIGWIEMNDPPANTYTYEMMQQLDAAILSARMDGSVHVIILRGAGDKFFSAGANIKMLSSVTLGKSRSIELMTTGRTFSFEEAEEMGLVNQVFDRDNFFEEVTAYAGQFLPPSKAARAVGRIKRSVQSGLEMPFSESLALERELQQHLFQSEDAHEGLVAYVEKRTPHFRAK
jgi:enoyl-CoA hydratase/carnithine racemase